MNPELQSIICKELQKNPNFIKLGFQFLGPAVASHLAPILSLEQCTIVYLDLTGNQLGDEGAQIIAQALRTNTSLQYLNLSMNDIASTGAGALCNILSLPTQTLASTGQQQHQQQLEIMGDKNILTSNTTLQHLDLSMNRLGYEGFEHVCNLLKSKHSLVTLSLRSNRMTSKDAVSKMLEILALREQSTTLKEVFL